ncbi:hypothetical protein CRG98_015075 [Punica granatum]|uniref:Uncharacterized protein n=1 Tax=Punica granatum TaxID=22663 RepID=A0A2I0K7J8_PUNGR|nr:hypothetical protein CRG98_015075 [Punica granatum]
MDKTRESVRLEMGENFPDSSGPRELSATFLHGGLRMLPSLDVRGKEPGKQQEGRVTRLEVAGSEQPERGQPRQVGEKRVGALVPVTALCEVGLVGLLKDGSR